MKFILRASEFVIPPISAKSFIYTAIPHSRAFSRVRPWRTRRTSPVLPATFGARPFVIQRRFLLGPFLRLARSGFAITAGAAAGGAAYANHKFSEATNSVSEKFDKATNWIGDVWDKFDLKGMTEGFGDGSTNAGSRAADEGSSNTSGNGNANTNGGGSGGSGGGGESHSAALSAVTASVMPDGNDDEDGYADQLDQMDNQMILLTRKMIEIRNILLQVEGSNNVQLPSIVVIGSQSSGKSSVLEGIVGHEFLPKGSNMVTRRPIELTLIHENSNDNFSKEYCEFPGLGLGQITSFREVQKILTDLNLAVPKSEVVSEEPIQLKIYSPHVPDLTLIDLPGYIQVVAADQPLELKSRIAALCEKYIQPPNVILAVSAADVDLANSTALRASRRVDPKGVRTIGVITKMDLVDAERGVATLLTREYPLRMGYVGVVTRIPQQGMASSLFGPSQNKTKLIARSEKEFFSDPTYARVNWGVLKLRETLTKVLEKSMVDSLEPTKKHIRAELEEASYAFKVKFNDRTLTPQTYLAQCADAFKLNFKEMSAKFGRDQIRELIKQQLDQKVLDLLAETYWNPPPGVPPRGSVGAYGGVDEKPADLSDLSSPKPDLLMWQYKIDQLSGSLTRAGIGRLSTGILVDAINNRMEAVTTESLFGTNPIAMEQIKQATDSILASKFFATSEQIENSIKPYKYEVEVDAREWQQSREYSCNLLKEELRQCQSLYSLLESEIGGSKLKNLIKTMNSPAHAQNSERLDYLSQNLISKVRTASFLKDRMDLLKSRVVFIKSSKCKSSKNKALCPEVFMDVVSSKLAATSVLFLNFELLSDFYYSFPREFDARLQSLTEEQVEHMATQDSRVKAQIELQHRKELLQLALTKLQSISELREMEGGRK